MFLAISACLASSDFELWAQGFKSKPPVLLTAPAAYPRVQTLFVEVHPIPREPFALERSRGQGRAVVLLHGLRLHPFNSNNVGKATFHDWQKPGSPLVEALAKYADVFAFAYSENVPVGDIAGVPGLEINLWRLKQMGYQDIVLVGHSAGGLIARQFVEDHPGTGVTKVVQICTPNGGSSFARVEPGFLKSQRVFLYSLTKEARAHALKLRAYKRIPKTIQFLCLVGDGAGLGDGVVSTASQWPKDLQDQGIPAVALRTTHFAVMRSKSEAEKIADLIRRRWPRWSAAQVAAAKKALWGQ